MEKIRICFNCAWIFKADQEPVLKCPRCGKEMSAQSYESVLQKMRDAVCYGWDYRRKWEKYQTLPVFENEEPGHYKAENPEYELMSFAALAVGSVHTCRMPDPVLGYVMRKIRNYSEDHPSEGRRVLQLYRRPGTVRLFRKYIKDYFYHYSYQDREEGMFTDPASIFVWGQMMIDKSPAYAGYQKRLREYQNEWQKFRKAKENGEVYPMPEQVESDPETDSQIHHDEVLLKWNTQVTKEDFKGFWARLRRSGRGDPDRTALYEVKKQMPDFDGEEPRAALSDAENGGAGEEAGTEGNAEVMKYVILSADSSPCVYQVPAVVADHLKQYCLEFCDDWLKNSPEAEPYRRSGYLCYTEKDFIDYLNRWVFPEYESRFVEDIGWIRSLEEIPPKYRGCPDFNF